MKILHITNNYPTHSLPIFGIFVKEQIDTLSNNGIHNDILFINGYEKGKLEYLRGIFRIKKVLRHNHYDLIHCHHALTALTFTLCLCKKKIPAIVSFQNDPVNEHGLKIFNIIKKRFDACIFKNNSSLIKELDGHGYYLPNGVDINFFKPMDQITAKEKLNLDIKKKYILFISSFVVRKQKRMDRYNTVMDILINRYPEENFEKLVLVNIERKYMPYNFNAASLHLLTSDFEGSPNSIKESIACNTPVVSTDVGNVRDMLKNSTNCFVSKDNSPETLAKLVYKVLKQEKTNCRDLIFKNKLDKDSVTKNLLEIYNTIIANYVH
jgi:glycosyltransferase involved in cell wall biosynthesis